MQKKAWLLLAGASMSQATVWKNWAQNQQCTAFIVTPKNTQELARTLQKAHQEKATVHAYGTGHSWSNIVCADYIINTDKLNKVLSIDAATNQVTVQAGIKLKDLNNQLAKKGLCLSNQAAITDQSIAGVVATATHGSGKTGTFASFITRVQLMTADGKLQTFSLTENNEIFNAARTNLGLLGIITELTIQCEPLFKVRRVIKHTDWNTILKEYEQLLHDNDFMQFYWNVSDDSVEILIHNKITTASTVHNKTSQSIDSYKMLAGPRGGFYMEEEIAVPRTQFIAAAQAARNVVQQEYTKNNMFSGILFRFVSADSHNWLSPAADRDVVFLSITTTNAHGYELFYKKFYDRMLPYGGRPHWGKINYITRADAHTLYGKNIEQFIAIRKQLDPQGLFLINSMKPIFDSL